MDEYTVIGQSQVPPTYSEAIAEALMDCAADHDDGGEMAVSVDVHAGLIEIEVIVSGSDEVDALANAKILIFQVCSCAEFPVEFVDGQRPCPDLWSVVPPVRRVLEIVPEPA